MRRATLFGLTALGMVACGPSEAPKNARTQPPPQLPSSAPAMTFAPEAPPKGALPSDVHPTHYTLVLEVVPDHDRFAGTVEIATTFDKPRDVVFLHAKGLTIKQASVRSEGAAPVSAEISVVDPGGVVALKPARFVDKGRAVIRVDFDAPFGDKNEGLYREREGGKTYAFTQFESTFARQAFPCFDEPGFKTPWDIVLFVPKDAKAIANTHEIERVAAPGGLERVTFATTEPLPSYLVAVAVGALDIVAAPPIPANGVRSKPLPLRGVATFGRGGQLGAALAETARVVDSLEKYTGVPYPFDKLDILAVPGKRGAMENAGAITFGARYLLLDEKTAEVDQKITLASIIAHEVAHQWTGDLVTMKWWDDTWLNEAFATWLGDKTYGELHPEFHAHAAQTADMFDAMRFDALASARRVHEPVADNNAIVNAFDGITYQKGGAVLRMFEGYAGPTFQKGLHAYLGAHKFGNATEEDFLRAESAAKGADLETPFKSFLDQPGTPFVEANVVCEAQRATLHVKQSRYLPLGSSADARGLWSIPLCVKVGAKKGSEEVCKLVDKPEMDVDLPGEGCPRWVMPNARGDGYYQFGLNAADEKKLADAGLAALDGSERLAFGNSVEAAFARGSLDVAGAVHALEKLANDGDPLVAEIPDDFLEAMEAWIDGTPDEIKLRALVDKIYKPAFKTLGFEAKKGAKESDADKRRRADVIATLALFGRDAEVRAEANKRGRKVLGLDGDKTLHIDADVPELLDTDLMVAALEASDAELATIIGLTFVSEDETVRGHLLHALSALRDPKHAAVARELTLDPRLRQNEVLAILGPQLARAVTRQEALAYVERHADALFARLPPARIARSFWMFSNAIEPKDKARVRALLEPRAAKAEGGPRVFAGVTEAISIGAAKRDKHVEELRAFLNGKTR